MNEIPESKQTESNLSARVESSRAMTAIVAVVAVVAIAAIALLLWLFIPRGSGGRPVPAPRSIGPDQPGNQASNTPGDSTLTITPEQLQRAGIKIETVGERVSTDAGGQPNH